MNRLKLFIENFLIYGLGGVSGKMIPFFMLPVITRLMPDSYYMGINDIANSILSFSQAFAVMGMYDAMFRTFFDSDEKEFKREVCSSAFGFTALSSFFVFSVLIVLREEIAKYFFNDKEWKNLVVVTAFNVLLGATNFIVAAPTRMQNKRKIYLFTNLLTPLVSYLIAIVLLSRGKYIFALPIGSMMAAFLTELFFLFLNHRWFSIKAIKWKQIKEMLSIGLPLMPNFLIYWIFNSCDRIMISKILGMDYTGIYAVGAKFGHISQLIYTAFAGGWQYFAFSTMKDKDQMELTSKIFEYLGCLAIGSTVLITLCSEYFFGILFDERYVEAAIIVPYLFMAPLAQMLFQIVANQFLIVKKTWPSFCVLFVGSIVNIVLNAVLIPMIGIEGAAIATLAGFASSVLISVLVLNRMKLFQLNVRCKIVILLFILYLIGWRNYIGANGILRVVIGLVLIAFYIRLYWRELFFIIKILKIKMKNQSMLY